MYQIRYKDPMTGTILEIQAHSLTDAVTAIQKAKDDLYYRGHFLQKSEDLSTQVSEEDSAPEQEPSSNEDEPVKEDDHAEDDQDLDEFLYPYGVTLW